MLTSLATCKTRAQRFLQRIAGPRQRQAGRVRRLTTDNTDRTDKEGWVASGRQRRLMGSLTTHRQLLFHTVHGCADSSRRVFPAIDLLGSCYLAGRSVDSTRRPVWMFPREQGRALARVTHVDTPTNQNASRR